MSARLDALRRYMEALDQSDYETIVGLFAPAGRVTSPFLGTMGAAQFFEQLGTASSNNDITPLDIFVSESGTDRAVAYFQYDWTMADGSVVVFKVMDLFTFEAGTARFASLDIIYDTHPVRAEHGDKYERLTKGESPGRGS